MIRKMINEHEGVVFYQSTFDTLRGILVREVERQEMDPQRSRWGQEDYAAYLATKYPKAAENPRILKDKFSTSWLRRFNRRKEAFSPSPETIDISITNWCNFGCTYCYQDSTVQQSHAPPNLVEATIKSFTAPPYQIAIGGGEPTAHPELPAMLRRAKELGVVPNYTTAGHIVRDDVIEATNDVCGGVSITYHRFKGPGYFMKTYAALQKRLKVPLNVHVIADAKVDQSLEELLARVFTLGPLSIILLAYYPDVGRGSYTGIMPRNVFNDRLPKVLAKLMAAKCTIAYSEGLLPYFLSRPELGLANPYASRSEGNYSCYVDPRGCMSFSSFDPPFSLTNAALDSEDWRKYSLLQGYSLQQHWDAPGWEAPSAPAFDECGSCKLSAQCAAPHSTHYLQCAFTPTGKP